MHFLNCQSSYLGFKPPPGHRDVSRFLFLLRSSPAPPYLLPSFAGPISGLFKMFQDFFFSPPTLLSLPPVAGPISGSPIQDVSRFGFLFFSCSPFSSPPIVGPISGPVQNVSRFFSFFFFFSSSYSLLPLFLPQSLVPLVVLLFKMFQDLVVLHPFSSPPLPPLVASPISGPPHVHRLRRQQRVNRPSSSSPSPQETLRV